MNVFEDLIEELKEEHLLEETIIEAISAEEKSQAFAEIIEAETFLEKFARETEKSKEEELPGETPDFERFGDLNLINDDARDESQTSSEASAAELSSVQKNDAENEETVNEPTDEASFYRRRAIEEVSCLQMVEHILSGVERDLMKVNSKSFDDLEVKKALHSFLQISGEVNSPEHAQAEFQLMQETESWYSALSYRDKKVSVSNLRLFCETTHPILSAHALSALALFYRNLPYSETARNKFDFIVTRLFSEELEDNRREILFNRDELIKQIGELYSKWTAASGYSFDEDDSDLLLTAFKFEDFMAEADNAESFDELIRSDFFNRLHSFKESAGDYFFAPMITASAIESNVRIGNRYVELVEIEREKGTIENIEAKHDVLHDQIISNAVSKTFKLSDLLREIKIDRRAEKAEVDDASKTNEIKAEAKQPSKFSVKSDKGFKQSWFGANRWLLISTVCIVFLSFGLHFWAQSYPTGETVSPNVTKVNLENSALKEYVKEALINKDVFFGTTQSSWKDLSPEKKDEALKQILSVGREKGFTSVNLQDGTGKTVGAATSDTVVVY